MRSKTLLTVAYPSLAEVADRSNHLKTGRVDTCMFDDTITALHHTLLFTTRSTHGKFLNGLTEITISTILLHSLAFVALHGEVARGFGDIFKGFVRTDVFLTQALLFSFLSCSCLLFRHFGGGERVNTETSCFPSSFLTYGISSPIDCIDLEDWADLQP